MKRRSARQDFALCLDFFGKKRMGLAAMHTNDLAVEIVMASDMEEPRQHLRDAW